MRCADESSGVQAYKIIAFFPNALVEDLIYTGKVTEYFPSEFFKLEGEAIILQAAVFCFVSLGKVPRV